MRFTLALFAAGAVASNLVARQGTLAQDIASIQSATESLTTAIEAYQGDIQQALAINGASGEVVDAVNAAIATANGLTEITQDQALTLVNPIQDLAAAVNTSITALIGKAPIFATAGLTDAVVTTLQSQQTASAELTDAIVSKLPAGLQETARNLSAPIDAAFAAGLAAFQGGAAPTGSATSAMSMTSMASATASATGSVTAPTVAPGYTTPAANGTMPSATYSPPVQYTGAAMPSAVAGLGAVAIGALLAAF